MSNWSLHVIATAVASATCGSLASVCGKIAFDTSDLSLLAQIGIDHFPLRVVVFVFLILLNSVMLSLYVKVLQLVSALQASLLAFVCNYLISTFVGVLLFGESVSVKWLLGAAIMTSGAARVAMGKHSCNSKKLD